MHAPAVMQHYLISKYSRGKIQPAILDMTRYVREALCDQHFRDYVLRGEGTSSRTVLQRLLEPLSELDLVRYRIIDAAMLSARGPALLDRFAVCDDFESRLVYDLARCNLSPPARCTSAASTSTPARRRRFSARGSSTTAAPNIATTPCSSWGCARRAPPAALLVAAAPFLEISADISRPSPTPTSAPISSSLGNPVRRRRSRVCPANLSARQSAGPRQLGNPLLHCWGSAHRFP
mmetsp:Transcript_53906/g.112577  ORF Transcript_53906/g.112577 Transcript_53906/m.112577 type:complete len:235 (-) Transcript_53906:45-749(-)